MTAPPNTQSPEYQWWAQGTIDEGRARDQGLSSQSKDLRDTLESLARLRPASTPIQLVAALARIYCPDLLRRKYRKAS